jgi:hypothetical protein
MKVPKEELTATMVRIPTLVDLVVVVVLGHIRLVVGVDM